jgi:hypothetical protein
MLSAAGGFICERRLSLGGGGQVIVRIGAPTTDHGQPSMAGDNCFCAYQIIGVGDEKIRKTWGVDSCQAVYLVLMAVGVALYSSDEARTAMLTWEAGSVPGDLGFPVPEGLRDIVPFGASVV